MGCNCSQPQAGGNVWTRSASGKRIVGVDDVTKKDLEEFLENAAHGAHPDEQDLQLLLDSLKNANEQDFVLEILRLTREHAKETWTAGAEYYMLRVNHDRVDVNPFLGSGSEAVKGKTITSNFSASPL